MERGRKRRKRVVDRDRAAVGGWLGSFRTNNNYNNNGGGGDDGVGDEGKSTSCTRRR